MNAVVKIEPRNTDMATREPSDAQLVRVLQNSLYPGAGDESVALVLDYCHAMHLDPMQKPVHIVPMWNKDAHELRDVIMPGIGLYRTQAARTGQLAGISEPVFGPDVTETLGGVEVTYPQWCRVTVRRRLASGEIAEFTACERWKENYAIKGGKDRSIAPNAMWQKRPYGQLGKCSQAQALRTAFPEMTGAQPTADEMEGKTLEEDAIDVTPSVAVVVEQPKSLAPYPDASFAKNCEAWKVLVTSGKKTPQDLIALFSSKYTLSDQQRADILALGVHAEPENLDAAA